jgi:hypothetical protein
MTEPLRLEVIVACPVEHAFAVWANRIDTWWPRDHTASGEADARVVLEHHVGDRINEVTADGTEHEWRGDDLGAAPSARVSLVPADGTIVGDRHGDPVRPGRRRNPRRDRARRLGAARRRPEAWRGRNHAGWTTLRHSHVLGESLHCSDGLGLVVSRDGTVIHLRPGDTDYTPPVRNRDTGPLRPT